MKADGQLIEALRQQIIAVEGGRPGSEPAVAIGLGEIESAFPGGGFPRGTVHELLSYDSADAACTTGFIGFLAGRLMASSGSCAWISMVPRRCVYPAGLAAFGLMPERIHFIDTRTRRDTLWVIEESLKCGALSCVVGELSELGFQESRRLQLACEKSSVTCLLHRFHPRQRNAVAAFSRWRVTRLPGEAPDGLPGVGYARWHLALEKIRHGEARSWNVECIGDRVRLLPETKEEAFFGRESA